MMQKLTALFVSIGLFFGFIGSFFSRNFDEDFTVATGEFNMVSIVLNGEKKEVVSSDDFFGAMTVDDSVKLELVDGKCDWFNYFSISYQSDGYIKGTIEYKQFDKVKSEDFFLTPDETVFSSFIDGYLDNKKANEILSITFASLDKETAELGIHGISTFNRRVEDEVVYIRNDSLKIGIDLHWGGALSYLEDLDSDVEVVKKDGRICVDSNASDRYNTLKLNGKVNLINCYDAGRLVQQSYYGTFDGGYEGGEYMGGKWNYNPVQGGNKYNEASKIVDLRYDNEHIYVKCRPLDWSREKEYITPSYMEATYRLDGGKLRVECRFTDFSGYPSTYTTQEMPAFYCIEPLDNFYYCDNGEIKCRDDLIFWPDAGYPNFPSNENWIAFTGEFDDSFGIGLYVPGGESFLAGISEHGKTTKWKPCNDVATSYVALVRYLDFKSYAPIEYNYCITTGTVDEIRRAFNAEK